MSVNDLKTGLSCFLCGVKVLIIHQHFKTPDDGGAIRSYYLSKALVENGIDVVVITAGNNKSYTKSNYEGIEVHALPIPYDNGFGFWKRGRSFMLFVMEATRLAKSIPSIDLCYAISVPLTTGIIARRLKASRNIPYFFEVGDLWPDAPIQLGYVKNYFLKQFLYGLEKSTYEKADAIIALSTSISDAIHQKMGSMKIYLIPNMADTTYFLPGQKNEALVKKFKVDGKFVVSYIGALGVANGLDYFVDCARASMQAGLPVHFILCGEGALLEQHKANVKKLGLINFTFIPFQDRAGVRDIMNVTDATFVCYKPFRILETGSPNKYFDGLAAGKLILINFEGWIKNEIEQERCGVYINRQKPSDFVPMISPFLADRVKLNAFQKASRDLALQKYSRDLLGDRFVSVIKNH